MEYVPLWTAILDEPNWKILDLPSDVYRFWSLCLIAAQKYDYIDGYLPEHRTLCAWLQMTVTEALRLRDDAVARHVLDRLSDGRFRVHNWEHWRNVKDATATKRSRMHRAKKKALKSDATEPSRNGHGHATDMQRACNAPTDNRHSEPVGSSCLVESSDVRLEAAHPTPQGGENAPPKSPPVASMREAVAVAKKEAKP